MATKDNTKSEILIAWTSDWHLRNSQYARASRGEDFTTAAVNATKAIINSECDIAVNCGDIFHVSRPSPKNIADLISIDLMLQEAEVPMLCITGNHDMSAPTWLSTLFPRRVRADGSFGVGIIPVDNTVVTFKGVKFGNILPVSRRKFIENVDDLPDADIFLYHILVNDFMSFKKDADYSIADFPAGKYKAILLGDIHMNESKVEAGTFVGYPGSTEMGSSSESTRKVVKILKYDGASVTEVRDIPISTRKFLRGTISTESELDELIATLKECRDENPVVVYKYDTLVKSVIPRVFTALNSDKSVIKLIPLPTKVEVEDRLEEEDSDDIPITKFLEDTMAGQHDMLINLATTITLHPDRDVHAEITEFIEKRTNILNENN